MFGSPACSTPWRRFGLVATLLLLAHQPVAAQPARNVGIVSDADRARVGFDPAESAGLFIGIRTFDDDQLADVPYAVDDAIDLAHLFAIDLALMPASKVVLALEGEAQKAASRTRLQELRRAGARVKAATRSDFYRLLEQQGGASGPRGLFVVSVASHGFSEAGRDSLVTYDAVPSRIVATGFQLSELIDLVGSADSPRRIVLIDACKESLMRRRGSGAASGLARSFAEAVEQVEGMAILTGATPGGFAYDDPERKNGVFTAAILDGLRGGAAADDRGFITVEALARFAQDQVMSWVDQHRRHDRGRSRGITNTIEGPVAELPLAVDRTFVTRARRFEARKAEALETLKSAIGAKVDNRIIVTGRMADDVMGVLASASEGVAEPWLDRIEAFDGTQGPWESFAFYYNQNLRPVPPPPPSPSPPPRHRQAGDQWIEPTTGMRFRYIPAGTFQMGSPEDEDGREDNEIQHEVTLTQGYWMGETEVTQAQWRAVMGNNPSRFRGCGDDCPIESVNWFEAVAFANAMSEKARRIPCYLVSDGNGKVAGAGLEYETVEPVRGCDGFRLPTEAEWERAARAGRSTAHHSPELDPIAWYDGNSGSSTHPVGTKQPDRWGLRDMLGNVWEWCSDWHGRYSADAAVDPAGPSSGALRVLRGGSWGSNERRMRAAVRLWNPPDARSFRYGFRLSLGQI